MNGRSKVLAPLATVVAVAAVAVTASLVAGGDDGPRSPKVLRLADAAATRDSAPTTAGSGGSGGYRLTGDLPEGRPDDAPAWSLPEGPAAAAPVARLANALKAGTPKRDGNGWIAGGLRVNGEAGQSWYFYSCGPEAPRDLPISPDTPVSSDGSVGCAVSVGGTVSSGSGSSGSGSSGSVASGTVTAEPVPPEPVTDPAPPISAPAKPQSAPATGAPAPFTTAVPPPPSPAPAPPTPSKDTVRTAAAPVLEAVGLDVGDARVTVYPGGGSVSVDPRVGSLDTTGFTTRVEVGGNGDLLGASGWLADPEKADTYPLVSARAAFDALPEGVRILSCEFTPEGGCKEPVAAEITGAHLGLTVAQLADGGQVLLPAWLFDVKGSEEPVASVAVEPRFLASGSDPGTDPTKPSTEPGSEPVGPPTQVDPAPGTDPGTIEPAPSQEQVAITGASRSKADNAVTVFYDNGGCGRTGVRAYAKEDDQAVYVVLQADTRPSEQACTSDFRPAPIEVALQAPLGDRKVIDVSTGKPVPLS